MNRLYFCRLGMKLPSRNLTCYRSIQQMALVVVLLFLILSTSFGDSRPVRRRIRSNRLDRLEGWTDLSWSRNRRAAAASSSAVGHIVAGRPGDCLLDSVYEDCFLCGRMVDDSRIYVDCCMQEEHVKVFCQQMLL